MLETRLARPADASALAEMNWQFNHVRMPARAVRSRLRAGREIVALAVDGKVPVGFACAQVGESMCYPMPHAELTELFVKAGHRRRGVGTALVTFMEREFSARGVGHIHILTGMRNTRAQSLYRVLGYAANRHPEILFEKNVTAGQRAAPRRFSSSRRRTTSFS